MKTKKYRSMLRSLTVKPSAPLACSLLQQSQKTGVSAQKLFAAKVEETAGLRSFLQPVHLETVKAVEDVASLVAIHADTTKKLFLAAQKTQTHPRAEEINSLLMKSLSMRAALEEVLSDILIDSATLDLLQEVYVRVEQSLAKTTPEPTTTVVKTTEPDSVAAGAQNGKKTSMVPVAITKEQGEAVLRLLKRCALDR
jgi:hypothetical protein